MPHHGQPRRLRLASFLTVAVVAASLGGFSAHAHEDLLSGLWMETANFPASSIIRFERHGDKIVGKYRQVSTPQRHWGFQTGEMVIQGRVDNNVFQGQVLLKRTDEMLKRCPDFVAFWAPIELRFIEPGKLYGRWRQTHFDARDPCKPVANSWQLYGLEKIQTD
ncbi:hypothetical protein [Paracidovorax sp. MALMAid1276]|uniref:hypothetical protein n=1 Tax=Paracidovorax sp. MALMAid1276 TaxID=3411631 RepID=UPI003BA01885